MTTTSARMETGIGSVQFASGKIILLGEHAVVYGVPAIACGLDVGARASARLLTSEQRSSLDLDGTSVDSQGESPINRAFRALLESLGSPPVRVVLRSEIPPRCGLGASAAHGVAIARAVLSALAQEDVDHQLALTAATAWEKVFHGNPSGVDTAAVLHGGCIRYRIGAPVHRIALPRPLTFVVAIADAPASTSDMVSRVARAKHERSAVWQQVLRDIAACVEEAEECLKCERLERLGELLDRNHESLAALDLATPAIERARAVAKHAGALGVKLTGSGGGGAIIALTHDDSAPVLAALDHCDLRAFSTQVQPGVTPIPSGTKPLEASQEWRARDLRAPPPSESEQAKA
ncbi:MAG TPA: mevalonate kinase [Polyangiaceae bacterium]|nr:mevalonate kinase [Polyangiaceae bacterium]